MEPLGVKRRYVPHLKGPISGKGEPKDQGRGSTITLCHAHLKRAILHQKTAIVWIFFCLTVVCLGKSLWDIVFCVGLFGILILG